MNIALETSLAPLLPYLRVVLQAGEDAKVATRGLHPKVCRTKHGPYDIATWLDNVGKNLDDGAPVRLAKDGMNRNWIEADCGPETIRFAPYFGTIDSKGRYSIPRKGIETYALDGLQGALFVWKQESKPIPSTVFPYVLRIIRKRGDVEAFELHFLLGDLPGKDGAKRATIAYHGKPFIVTMGDGPTELPAAFTSPYDPQGAS